MRLVEAAAVADGLDYLRLMENAGSAAARVIRTRMPLEGKSAVILCGRGNNGGDGFVIARKLMEEGAAVTAILVCGEPAGLEAGEMLSRIRRADIAILSLETEPYVASSAVKEADLVVDAVYGIGFHGTLPDHLRPLFRLVNGGRCLTVSIDVPSGLNADTGVYDQDAIQADPLGRVKEVQKEIDWYLSREADCHLVVDYLKSGELPLRCTHNDTKLNNVMLDDVTGEGICVIDLDTTMPGSAIYDFGDMIRTATSPAAEDEKDISKVTMRMFMFEALVQGYVSSAKSFLTPLEKSLLPFSGKLLTMECGIRFLTDYLSGDVYFKIHRPEHNLDRCRTQMALVESIEAQMDEMKAVVDRY